MTDRIYLDYAATTPVSQRVLKVMLPFFTEQWGNASSVYAQGREARKAVEKARRQTAAALGAQPQEIYFTSGGTESDNQALIGTAMALRDRGRHLITSAIEHPAVLQSCQWLEKQGFEVTYVRPDTEGLISPEAVARAIRPETVLVSVMAANNEIGTIEPIREIGQVAHERGVLFHTDAVQAIGTEDISVERDNIDLLSLSAHKFNGPKGAGALYIRRGCRIQPFHHGGEQERALRPGTENVPAIAGLGEAIEAACENREEKTRSILALRDQLITGVLREIPDARLNGSKEKRLPGNCNFSFRDVDGEALLLRLDMEGVSASAGSACTSGSQEVSHVLRAIGLDEAAAKGSLRLTLGPDTTEDEIDRVLQILKRLTADLRNLFRH